MENMVSPWQLPTAVGGDGLTTLRLLLAGMLQGSADLGPALRGLHPGGLEVLRWQRLTPWIFSVVARKGLQPQVEDSLLQALRRDYALALQAAALEERQTQAVLRGLRQAGVEVMLFKGAELRLRLYQDAAARPLGDIDLLVSRDQVDTAGSVLEDLGFRLRPECLDPRPGFRRRFRRELHYEPPPDLPLSVDLHWQVDYPDLWYPFPIPRLRGRAHTLDCCGCPVKVPSPEHAYMLLLMHACDGFHGLFQLVDFALAPKFLPIDWQEFRSEVARLNFQAPIYLVLREVARHVEAAVPPAVLESLSGYAPTRVERLVLNRTLGEFTPHFVSLYRHRAWRDRLFYLGSILWPQPSYLRAVCGQPGQDRFLQRCLKKILSPRKA